MTWARVAVGLVLCGAGLAFAQADQAMAVYEQGKALYDAKNYSGALEKFDAAIALEPTKARWQYNRGLALKKLKRDDEARAALLKSRELEPDYKRSEIDDKLRELGGGSAPSVFSKTESESDGAFGFRLVAYVLIAGVVFQVFRKTLWKAAKWFFSLFVTMEPDASKSSASTAAPKEPIANRPNELQAVATRLGQTAQALSRLEHGLSLGEDAVVRSHAVRAATNLASVRKGLDGARRNQRPVAELTQALDRASEAITQGEQRLVSLRGDGVLWRRVRLDVRVEVVDLGPVPPSVSINHQDWRRCSGSDPPSTGRAGSDGGHPCARPQLHCDAGLRRRERPRAEEAAGSRASRVHRLLTPE